jgi:hypothetical protein
MLLLTGAIGRTQGQTLPPDMKAMMADHQHQMMMSMQAADTKLDQLVADLNAARGAGVEVRLDKMTAVVNELVAERKNMRRMMGMMHGAGLPNDEHSAHHPDPGK